MEKQVTAAQAIWTQIMVQKTNKKTKTGKRACDMLKGSLGSRLSLEGKGS